MAAPRTAPETQGVAASRGTAGRLREAAVPPWRQRRPREAEPADSPDCGNRKLVQASGRLKLSLPAWNGPNQVLREPLGLRADCARIERLNERCRSLACRLSRPMRGARGVSVWVTP